ALYILVARSPPHGRVRILVLFFFQAEDGIRDRNVTGVQTCALPISAGTEAGDRPQAVAAVHRRRHPGHRDLLGDRRRRQTGRRRSEERRVGKECISRWTREHQERKGDRGRAGGGGGRGGGEHEGGRE